MRVCRVYRFCTLSFNGIRDRFPAGATTGLMLTSIMEAVTARPKSSAMRDAGCPSQRIGLGTGLHRGVAVVLAESHQGLRPWLGEWLSLWAGGWSVGTENREPHQSPTIRIRQGHRLRCRHVPWRHRAKRGKCIRLVPGLAVFCWAGLSFGSILGSTSNSRQRPHGPRPTVIEVTIHWKIAFAGVDWIDQGPGVEPMGAW